MILYLVSRNPAPLVSALEASGILAMQLLEVRHVAKPPPGREGRERSICVLDLTNCPAGLQPPACCVASDTSYIVLVARQQTLSIPWVQFCASQMVSILIVEGGWVPDRCYRALTTLLWRVAGSFRHESLATRLVKRNVWLGDCADLVRIVLADPWRIRDPVDLARCAGVLPESLRLRCEVLHFNRVEHFITLVRWLAFELLTSVERMSAGRARQLVGIADPSNFRRQLRRVAYFHRDSAR